MKKLMNESVYFNHCLAGLRSPMHHKKAADVLFHHVSQVTSCFPSHSYAMSSIVHLSAQWKVSKDTSWEADDECKTRQRSNLKDFQKASSIAESVSLASYKQTAPPVSIVLSPF